MVIEIKKPNLFYLLKRRKKSMEEFLSENKIFTLSDLNSFIEKNKDFTICSLFVEEASRFCKNKKETITEKTVEKEQNVVEEENNEGDDEVGEKPSRQNSKRKKRTTKDL